MAKKKYPQQAVSHGGRPQRPGLFFSQLSRAEALDHSDIVPCGDFVLLSSRDDRRLARMTRASHSAEVSPT